MKPCLVAGCDQPRLQYPRKVNARCAEHHHEWQRSRYATNGELRAYYRRYAADPAHKERAAQLQAARNASRRDEVLARNRAYYAANTARVKARNATYQASDPARTAGYQRTRRERLAARAVGRVDRQAIFDRDEWTCWVCGGSIDSALRGPDPLSGSLDHVVQVARGGEHTPDNVRAAHLRCNQQRPR